MKENIYRYVLCISDPIMARYLESCFILAILVAASWQLIGIWVSCRVCAASGISCMSAALCGFRMLYGWVWNWSICFRVDLANASLYLAEELSFDILYFTFVLLLFVHWEVGISLLQFIRFTDHTFFINYNSDTNLKKKFWNLCWKLHFYLFLWSPQNLRIFD